MLIFEENFNTISESMTQRIVYIWRDGKSEIIIENDQNRQPYVK